MKITINLKDEENIRLDYVFDTLKVVLEDEEDLEIDSQLFWEKKNILATRKKDG